MKRKIKSENVRKRVRRALAVKKQISGTPERPRLTVYKSSKHIYAQLVDDENNQTLATVSTLSKELREGLGELKKVDRAEKVGAKVAELAKAKGIETVIFDRNGWRYHGRVAALAKGAREGGLRF